MGEFTGLGYVGVAATDLGAWRAFAHDVVGAQVIGETSSDLRVKIDGRRWRLAVHRGDADRLAYVGLELTGPDEYESVRRRLETGGIAVEAVTGNEATDRSVLAYLRCQDPAGTVLELFYGQSDDYVFRSPQHVTSFVTGGLGMGHAVLLSPHFEECLRFYITVLGFRLREMVSIGDARLAFLGCGPRHHSIALAEANDTAEPVLQHLMVEVGHTRRCWLRARPCQ
jgi:2,3-dihydroxybiphenyl 1,2-dioxygenase